MALALHGRDADLRRLHDLMQDERLVTVTGPGGVGKSALVAGAVRRSQGRCGADLLRLDLAEATGERQVEHALLNSVHDARPVRRPLLLVVETCDRVRGAAARAIADLLAQWPELRVVATSRLPLPGVFPVVGPGSGACLPLDPLTVADTVRLVRAAAPPLEPADENHLPVVCELLDGLPLAALIVAGQLAVTPAEMLLERLSGAGGGLDLPAREPAGPDRHRSLRHSLVWSHRLCTHDERLLWARTGVFPGDFGLADAASVCADEQLPGPALPAAFAGLIRHGVLVRTHDDRVRLPRAARAFGRQQLSALGEDTRFQRRCVRWSLGTATPGED